MNKDQKIWKATRLKEREIIKINSAIKYIKLKTLKRRIQL